jgi:hypothetical protein
MEQKIVDTLEKMGAVLGQCMTPSDKRLYALQRLKIKVTRVDHKDRHPELTKQDKAALSELFKDLLQYFSFYDAPPYERYYVKLFIAQVTDILNVD